MYKINKRGPNIDPWGTPWVIFPISDGVLLFKNHMAYDFLSNFKTSYNYYLLFHMHTIFPVSKAFEIFSTIVKIAWFVEWYFLNPNWKLYSILLCSRKSITWLYILYKNRRSPKLVCSFESIAYHLIYKSESPWPT